MISNLLREERIMTRQKKSDKSGESETAPWAVEVEFYNKPSFMASIVDITVDKDHISLTREDGVVLGFPRDAVRKVLVMHTIKKSAD
jgi:hypothetical protein